MNRSNAVRTSLLCLIFLSTLGRDHTSHADEPLPRNIVDTHVHLWDLSRPEGIYWIPKDNQTLYQNMLPERHQEIAKQNGVTGVIVVQAGQSLPDNQWNLDITRHNPKLYQGVVGNLSEVIGTDKFEPLFLKLCEDPRYVGYRLSGRYQDELSDAFFRDLELTAQYGKTVDFLVGGYTLDDVTAIAKRVPQLKIMLDHFGGVKLSKEPLAGPWIESFQQAAKCPNVYCKVSALYGRFEQQPAPKDRSVYEPILTLALECFGEDRIVFGSDWPVTRTTGDYRSVLDLTHSFFDDHAPGAVEKLFSQNAKKFYGLDSP